MSGLGENFKPSVSILMLAKNKAPYIKLAASSVLESPRAELVLIEPGSRDNSGYICSKLKKEYSNKIILVSNNDNSAAEGLNNGLREAKGKLVGVLNADDVYLPGALEHVLSYFESHPEIDVLLTAGFLINEFTGKWKLILPTKITRRTLGLSPHGSLTFFHQGMFFRKNRLDNVIFNEENRINWDKEFLVELWQKKARIGYLTTPTAIFRLNRQSLTSIGFSSKSIAENQKYFDNLINFNSSFFLALLFGKYLRLHKAINLLFHVMRIHLKSFIMNANGKD